MTYSALILAARRPGIEDPLATKHGVSHKCLIPMDGVPMIEHALRSLIESDYVGEIFISIDGPEALNDIGMIHDGTAGKPISIIQSRSNLFESVTDVLSVSSRFPVIICTADNALQTSEMVDHFCEAFTRRGTDAGVAMTDAKVIWAKYPDGQRRPYQLKDGKYSNCNLFGLKSDKAIVAARAFRGGGQFGKSKMRILKAFGLTNLIMYVTKALSLESMFRRISRKFGVSIAPILMPFAEAPIDVDNERTERIARGVLEARRSGEA